MPRMEKKKPTTIEALAERARACKVPIHVICRHAGVDYSTWKRWVAGTTSPLLHKLEAFEEAVAAAEKDEQG